MLGTINSIPEDFLKYVYIVNGGTCSKTSQLIVNTFTGNSEKDEGIADAFSKGVCATDGDCIHFLNSGDRIYDVEFYKKSLDVFKSTDIDYLYSNIIYKHKSYGDLVVTPSEKALRNLAYGMPFPHPGLIVRRHIFDKVGLFDKGFKIGMDYDFIVRMLREDFKGFYLNVTSVEMDGGGVSSSKLIEAILENAKSLKKNKALGLLEVLIICYRLLRTEATLLLNKVGFSIFQKKYQAFKQKKLASK